MNATIASKQSQQEQQYVHTVLRAYIAMPETPQRWHSIDRQIALDMFRRQIPVSVVDSALVLGSARRLGRDARRSVPPIRCLAYFLPVIEEVLAEPPPPNYIHHLRLGLPDQLRKLGLGDSSDWSK